MSGRSFLDDHDRSDDDDIINNSDDDDGRHGCQSPPPSPESIQYSSSSSVDGAQHPSSPELEPSSRRRSDRNMIILSGPAIQEADDECWNNTINFIINDDDHDYDDDDIDFRMTPNTTTLTQQQQKQHQMRSSSPSRRRRHARPTKSSSRGSPSLSSSVIVVVGTFLRVALRSMLDVGVWAVFALFVTALFLHKMHDDYIYPLLQLMVFSDADRDQTDITYYHRRCRVEDFLTLNATLDDLILLPPPKKPSSTSSSAAATTSAAVLSSGTTTRKNETLRLDVTTPHHRNDKDTTTPSPVRIKQFADRAADHMLQYGVSVYPNLLRDTTIKDMREWIVRETDRREKKGWHVQNGDHRVSWGFDMNDRYGGKDILHRFWKDLVTVNPYFLDALEAVLGPDPAVMEFAHITAEYGATDQSSHPDVSAYESSAKYARSFAPSYTLFIPLQDTTYEMGATHICPGSHVCGTGAERQCETFNVAMSGGRARRENSRSINDGSTNTSSTWQAGWGALMNSQTIHRGMAHTDPNAMDRVVITLTFVPRPNWNRQGQMDTRMLGLGSTYSILWHHWGHTFSDFLRADKRMIEPQKTLRSLGLIETKGWTHLTTTIMKMANKEIGYQEDGTEYRRFLSEGKIPFLPQSWQGEFKETSDINVFHAFFLGTLKRTEFELFQINVIVLTLYLSLFLVYGYVVRTWKRWIETLGQNDPQERENESNTNFASSSFLRALLRILLGYALIIVVAQIPVKVVNNTNGAKAIRSGKAYRLPWTTSDSPPKSTIPHRTDILWTHQIYASSYLTSYSRVLDFAHPGNSYWRGITHSYGDGYAMLSPPLQRDFCHTLMDRIQRERRFLSQDTERYWFKVIDQDSLARYCHRELTMASNSMTDSLMKQLDAMKNDIRYGFWRDMAIHERIIPAYLQTWEQRLLPWPRQGDKKRTGVEYSVAKSSKYRTQFTKLTSAVGEKSLKTMRTSRLVGQHRSSLPPVPVPTEPEEGAWIQEGDRVLALYKCKDANEWLSATITSAHPDDRTFDVVYGDGETEKDLPLKCIYR